MEKIGICFGQQIIARALGGECVPNGDIWELGPTQIQLTDIGKQIFGSYDTLVCRTKLNTFINHLTIPIFLIEDHSTNA
jgi:GMP synthase-like glutamine amidotransferase